MFVFLLEIDLCLCLVDKKGQENARKSGHVFLCLKYGFVFFLKMNIDLDVFMNFNFVFFFNFKFVKNLRRLEFFFLFYLMWLLYIYKLLSNKRAETHVA